MIEKSNSVKLQFYHLVKSKFEQEKYLTLSDPTCKRSLFKLRGSSHRLGVETGRYKKPPTSREDRICKHCDEYFNSKCIDDETHVIESCPLYDIYRRDFSNKLSNILGANDTAALLVKGLANIFKSSNDIRLCRLQGKFTYNILEKHKVLEENPKDKPRKGKRKK